MDLHQKACKENDNNKKTTANLTIGISDLHLGHENFLCKTYWHTIDKLVNEISMLNSRYEWKNIFLITNGDVISGKFVYRNQHIQSHLQKDHDMIMYGSYILHLTVEKLERVLEKSIKIYIVIGNHEGKANQAHNFSVSIAHRLKAYGHNTLYASRYLIKNIADGFNVPDFNICAYHSFGNADYSSQSPSAIREFTRWHSQLAMYKRVIIQRFLVSHTHLLEYGRDVLGIIFDSLGGFMLWEKRMSFRKSGLIYYIFDENEEFSVRGVSGVHKQIKEMENKYLNIDNMKYVSDKMREAIQFEIELGLLQSDDYEPI